MTVNIELNTTQFLELGKLAVGCFAPLNGFMCEEEFNGVVRDMRLPNGTPFPLPVTLDVPAEVARAVEGAAVVTLSHNGDPVGEVVPKSIFGCNKLAVAEQVFGTVERAHPGVRFFLDGGDYFLGGPIRLLDDVRSRVFKDELTPDQTRQAFADRGWRRIAGFQTRNVPHRAHEYLQRVALEYVDGLFIQPLIGRKKKGDFTPAAIMTAYEALIAGFYPPERVMLGVLTTSMRYAGPREAVFHAIIRRNYGCTHFVVGRDHAGVGAYYGTYEAHALTRRFDAELGIEVLRLHGPYHCDICDSIVSEQTCPHASTHPSAISNISGSDMRAILSGGREPDPRLMRPEIVDAVSSIPLFIESGAE